MARRHNNNGIMAHGGKAATNLQKLWQAEYALGRLHVSISSPKSMKTTSQFCIFAGRHHSGSWW